MPHEFIADNNGVLTEAGQPYLFASNRSFRYGDGLFESIRVVNGKPFNMEHHVARLKEGMAALRIDIPPHYTTDYFTKKAGELITANAVSQGGRIRLSVYRDSDGFYNPLSNDAGYCMEITPQLNNLFELNEDGLSVDLYMEIRKPVNKLSIYKTCNSINYILAALWAKQNKLDDALLINDKGNIIEASSSNLFIVCNGVLYTPALTDGCLAGVMRMQIINIALENKIKVYECSLTPQNLLVADEVFLTSAVKGLQWIVSYKMKRYTNTLTRSLLEKLNQYANR
ncbi:MAG: aminotransferase class IV [Bacteroidota bacterium]